MTNEILKQKQYIQKIKIRNEMDGRILKYHVYTMGCKLNENDSEKIAGMLEEMGYIKTENLMESDFVIYNTCCIRENAEDKLFGKLGEVKYLKEQRNAIIAVCGCMMQEEHIVKRIRKSYRHTDIIFGTHTLHKLPELVDEVLEKNNKKDDVIDIDGEIYENIPIKRTNDTKALVSIINGCNNFCTFCIVPYVRGRERSRLPKDIILEVEELAKNGYKEITLLGQNVNSYLRVERERKIPFEQYKGVNSFATLLKAINDIDGIETIRFISPHPKDFTFDVIEAIRDLDKVSKSVHLPLQSGNNNVLKRMNRRYTKEQFLKLAQTMKKEIKGLALTTDIIVGFPGETDEEFEDTLDVVEQVRFEQVYMFIYSRRKGTVADKMENQIKEEDKHRRFNKLKQLVTKLIEEDNKKYIGTIQKVIVDGVSKKDENMLTSRTDTNKIVVFKKGEKDLTNQTVNVKINSDHLWFFRGEIV